MNTLIFIACGFAFISFLNAKEPVRPPFMIIKEGFLMAAGAGLFASAGFFLQRFLPVQAFEIQLFLSVVVLAIGGFLKTGFAFPSAVCSLGLWVLSFTVSWSGVIQSVLEVCFFYTFFLFILWSMRTKGRFYKTPAPFAGCSAPLLQAFWASVLTAVLAFVFSGAIL